MAIWLISYLGSSPLARGLRMVLAVVMLRSRIIPARAGFTTSTVTGLDHSPDHPRSRGVYPPAASTPALWAGSSPLARGLRRQRRRHRRSRGIIPARAGFTLASAPAAWRASGSSPHARGLRPLPGHSVRHAGIIPARAGFTFLRDASLAAILDHPRSRGVYNDRWQASWNAAGSSPLARGLLVRRRGQGDDHRIIPARAGFTNFTHRGRRRSSDHPRSRGVYTVVKVDSVPSLGSSPLARGLRLRRIRG